MGTYQTAPLSFGAAMLGVALLVGLIASVRPASSLDALERRPAPASGERASEDEPKTASKPGARAETPEPTRKLADDQELLTANSVAELEALAKAFPADPRVLAKLTRAQAAAPDGLHAAVGTLRRLAVVDAEGATATDLQTMLKRAASGPPETSALALDTMAASLGSVGVDLLYEIAISPGVAKKVRDEAMLMTKRDATKKLASPALKVALDLRDASGCERAKLFDTVEKVGDARSLQYLVVLNSRKGCGVFSMGDCYGCLGNRVALNRAIAAIKDRK